MDEIRLSRPVDQRIEMPCLVLGKDCRRSCSARGGDPPLRPAPTANCGIRDDEQRSFFGIVPLVAGAEEPVLR